MTSNKSARMLHTLTYNATMAPRCKKKSFGVVFGFCTTDSICIIVYYTVVAPELHHSIVRVNPYKIRRSNCKKSDCGARDGNRTRVSSLEGWRTTIVLLSRVLARPSFGRCYSRDITYNTPKLSTVTFVLSMFMCSRMSCIAVTKFPGPTI